MRNKLTKVMFLLASLMFVFSLAGCQGFEKAKIFNDYIMDLSNDEPYWEAAQAAADNIQGSHSNSEILSYAELCRGYLDKIVDNAEKRNQTITDVEIKDIDDSYVAFVTSMRDGYKDLIDGVKTGDTDKFNRGNILIQDALNKSLVFSDKVSAYQTKYKLKPSDDVTSLEHLLTGK
ncbi:MAG: hypothetical protein K5776_11195 [Lachnospiraceae bacterium]|nr:hypothetical protein [Lachnospiraceae bacterium]